MDDGRLTDGKGNVVDFRNTIIILTSNLGSEEFLSEASDSDQVESKVLAKVKKFFRPEFVNRLDEMIVFQKLSFIDMERIVKIHTDELARRLSDRKIAIELDGKVEELLARKGFDLKYGARPLSRVIQKEIMDPLAEGIISGAVQEGHTVKIDCQDGRVILNSNVSRITLVN